MDVLIIGAGAVGLNIAYYLRKGGADVTVIDRSFGDGCSFGNMGLLVPSHLIPLAAPGAVMQGLKWMFNPESPFYIKPRMSPDLFRWLWAFRGYCTEDHVKRSVPILRDLQIASRDLTARLARDEGLDCEYAQTGLLMLYHDEAERECVELERTARDAGMDAERVSEFEFETTAKGGLLIREDAQLHPGKFMRQLRDLLVKMGVTIHTNREVTSIRDIPYKELVLAA